MCIIRKPALAGVLALTLLAGCTAEQQQAAAKYHADIQYVCRQAMAVAPMFPAVAPWLVGACQSEAAVARLALRSDSLEWLSTILGRL